MNGVWLIWGDRQASRISYIPLLSVATRFTRIYGVHLATAADHGIFAFCGFDGPREYPGWLWPIEAFYCVTLSSLEAKALDCSYDRGPCWD
ncbi:unnamed protein product [Penicillium camemberti]|uniref:Str. FM013 n=1 Tax=Penicillium camemberti (strain FM 013) TaxID=1429867 RepID=A0A0G4PQ79_PENC3|nr:unnamed protein product [Penicillium camemberti]